MKIVCKKQKLTEKGLTIGVSAVFNIPVSYRHLITYKTEVIYAAQLNLDSGHNLKFPYNRDDEERYMGAKIRLKFIETWAQSSGQEKNLKNLPLHKLLDKNTWK